MNRRILYILALLSLIGSPLNAAFGQATSAGLGQTTQPTQPTASWKILTATGGDDGPNIQAAWNAGFNAWLSGAGPFHIREILRRPAALTLRGDSEFSTVLIPQTGMNGTTGQDWLEGSGLSVHPEPAGAIWDGGGISDLTIDGTQQPGTMLYHENVAEPGLQFHRLRLVQCLGPVCNSAGGTLDDVEVINGGISVDWNQANIHRITFHGPTQWALLAANPGAGSECVLGGANISVSDLTFIGTCRGINFGWATSNSLFLRCYFYDVNALPTNSNECVLDEGAAISGTTFDTFIYRGCRGRTLALDGGAISGNTFVRFDIDGGEGLSAGYTPQMGGNVTGDHFTQWQMTRCVHFELNSASGNIVDSFNIADPEESWTNQFGVGYVCGGPFFVQSPGVSNSIDFGAGTGQTVKVSGFGSGYLVGVAGQ